MRCASSAASRNSAASCLCSAPYCSSYGARARFGRAPPSRSAAGLERHTLFDEILDAATSSDRPSVPTPLAACNRSSSDLEQPELDLAAVFVDRLDLDRHVIAEAQLAAVDSPRSRCSCSRKSQKSPPIVATGTMPCTKISSSSTKMPNGATPVTMPVNFSPDLVAHEDDLLPLQHFPLCLFGAALPLARLRGVERVQRLDLVAALADQRTALDQLREPAVDDEVGIAADRRGEVAVVLDGQREVAERLVGVEGALHRAKDDVRQEALLRRSHHRLEHALQFRGADVLDVAAQRELELVEDLA